MPRIKMLDAEPFASELPGIQPTDPKRLGVGVPEARPTDPKRLGAGVPEARPTDPKRLGAGVPEGRPSDAEPASAELSVARHLGAQDVDCRLRSALHELQVVERNAVLWFNEVRKRRLFKELGYSSIYHYAGGALGFSRPRTAQFIRLCESLEDLPTLRDSVTAGEVSWTKAREVAKVATPQTESAWVELARRESRRKLERRVRLAQTRSRARRRSGGRQLGLADGSRPSGPQRKTDAGSESQGGRSCRSTTEPGSESSGSHPDAMQWNVDLANVPVTLSLRFTPEQYARYEAILEKLRKLGERGDREELILAGLDALLTEAGSGASAPAQGACVAAPSDRKTNASAQGAVSLPAKETVTPLRGAVSLPAKETVTPPSSAVSFPGKETVTPPSSAVSVPMREGEAGRARQVAAVSPRNSKPVYQIVVQQCEECGRARVQTSRGAKALEPAAAEAVRCDARVLRPGERNRATIPPAVRREVMARDGHRCRTPGCGSARFLEVHHVVPRAAGGSNRADNLVTLCSACHQLVHAHPRREKALGRRARE